MSSRGSTTIGFERRFNPIASIRELDAFVAESSDVSAPKPPNLARIVERNRGPFLPSPPAPVELPVPARGSQLLDVRPVADHLSGHLPGAVSVPVSGTSFSTKAGFVLDADAPVTVLAASADEALSAVAGLRSVALSDVSGYVLGGGPETTESVTVDGLEELIDAGAAVIDVRERDERDEGYIPSSRNVPYRLMRSCCPELPEDRPIVTICNSGPRAAIAASMLRAKGFDARPVVDGGMEDWLARGATAVTFRRCGN
jgi:hydroxyacylglutathione hydrolase